MRRNYRYIALRSLLEAAEPITQLQIFRNWAFNSYWESDLLQQALDTLVSEGFVSLKDNAYSLAKPLTPEDYHASVPYPL